MMGRRGGAGRRERLNEDPTIKENHHLGYRKCCALQVVIY